MTRLPRDTTWRVGQLLAALGEIVADGFGAITVRGEVSGFSRSAGGHAYFSLKDGASASLRCAMFKRAVQLSSFIPRDGDDVEVRGRLAIYEPRGDLQFIVEAVRHAGAGALYERFLRLKARLAAEGLFDEAGRRALPAQPRTVGIVTSLGAAALHDVATALARRSPHVRAIVYPSLVQGPEAPDAICAAIVLAARRAEVDVLIVCRGGGSLEDLWAFNDERVVRAVRASPIPVISGVGHETDVTLTDLAADLRAPTPTAAAELVAPATVEARQVLDHLESRLYRKVEHGLEREAQRLDRLAMRLATPADAVRRRAQALQQHEARLAAACRRVIAQRAVRLDALQPRLGAAAERALAQRRVRLDALEARLAAACARSALRARGRFDAAALRLDAVDPRRVLARGYALLTDPAGHPLTSVHGVRPGDALRAALADGQLDLRVESGAA